MAVSENVHEQYASQGGKLHRAHRHLLAFPRSTCRGTFTSVHSFARAISHRPDRHVRLRPTNSRDKCRWVNPSHSSVAWCYQMTMRSSGDSHMGSPDSIPKAVKKGAALRRGCVARTIPGACTSLWTSRARKAGRVLLRQTEAAAMKNCCSGENGGSTTTSPSASGVAHVVALCAQPVLQRGVGVLDAAQVGRVLTDGNLPVDEEPRRHLDRRVLLL